MRRIAVALVAVVALSSCTKLLKSNEFVSDRGYKIAFDKSYYVEVELPFDDVWATLHVVLPELGWTVATDIETSGTIATEEATIGTNRDRYACREWPGSATRVDEMRCKIAIHVRRESDTVTRVEALADISGRYVYLSSTGEEKVGGWWQCNSTGAIESELFDAFLTRFEPLKYEAPVYHRWSSK